MNEVRRVTQSDLLCELSKAWTRGEEPTEIVLGNLAFLALFGAGAPREGARFMDLPVRVDIKMINPHGFRIVSRPSGLLSGGGREVRIAEALAFSFLGLALFLAGYFVSRASAGVP